MLSGAIPEARQDTCRVLIASSDPRVRARPIADTNGQRVSVEEAPSGAQAMAKLRSFPFDLLILDRRLPDLDAEEVAEIVRKKFPDLRIQLVDSSAPVDERQAQTVARPSEFREAPHRGTIPPDESTDSQIGRLPGMVGHGPAMQKVYRLARLVAPRNTPVLIAGETGTGKELVARAVHQISERSKNPLVVVNC